MARPPIKIKQAMAQVMGSDTCSSRTICERLLAKGWLPIAADPRAYISHMLSSSRDIFERVPGSVRGLYKVKSLDRPISLEDSPWVDVSRRRLEGDIRVGGEGRFVRVFYEVTERRVLDGKVEYRQHEASRVVRTEEIVLPLLAEIVGKILPEIEAAAFAKIEDDLKLRFDGQKLVSDPTRSSPLAEALLGKDPF